MRDIGDEFVLGCKGLHQIRDVTENDDRAREVAVLVDHRPGARGYGALLVTGAQPHEVVGELLAQYGPADRTLLDGNQRGPVTVEDEQLGLVRIVVAWR
ncbi:hypothetical protein D9M68_903200 [compost metagenome]